jgi:hypothetical protein
MQVLHLWITQQVQQQTIWYSTVYMTKVKERATKQLCIYPSSYEKLRILAFKRRSTLPRIVRELLAQVWKHRCVRRSLQSVEVGVSIVCGICKMQVGMQLSITWSSGTVAALTSCQILYQPVAPAIRHEALWHRDNFWSIGCEGHWDLLFYKQNSPNTKQGSESARRAA